MAKLVKLGKLDDSPSFGYYLKGFSAENSKRARVTHSGNFDLLFYTIRSLILTIKV